MMDSTAATRGDNIMRRLRDTADIAEAGDKVHWAMLMRDAATEIKYLRDLLSRGDSDAD